MVYSAKASVEYLEERGWTYSSPAAGGHGWTNPAFVCEKSVRTSVDSVFPTIKMHAQSSGGGIGLPGCLTCKATKTRCTAASKATSRRYHWRGGVWVGTDVEHRSGMAGCRNIVIRNGVSLAADDPLRGRLSLSAPNRPGVSEKDDEVARHQDDSEETIDLSFYPEQDDYSIGEPGFDEPTFDSHDMESEGVIDQYMEQDTSDMTMDVGNASTNVTFGDTTNINDTDASPDTSSPSQSPIPTTTPKFSPTEINRMRDALRGLTGPGVTGATRLSATRLLNSLEMLEKGKA